MELSYLLEFYNDLNLGKDFFLSNNFIDKLAGSDQFRKQVEAGLSEEEIRFSWETDLQEFSEIRANQFPD